ncbi:MAG: ParA family protein [Acidimicrobiia bacterium]|nr:ParA family protein [Acidimicrobiia bacterium]
MVEVTAVANQKGGVAKTTSVQALGAALAEQGQRVLLVDLDPQACLTYSHGIDPDGLERSLHDVLLGRCSIDDVLLPVEGVDLVPAAIDLAGAEVHLLSQTGREYQLRRALAAVRDRYDHVLIDCPPSLGILTINGLTAASQVLIPLQCETLSHRGVGQLLDTIDDVRAYTNESLRVRGVVATLYDRRTKLSQRIVDEVTATYELAVLQPSVPKSVKAAEAPAAGQSVLAYAPRSPVSCAYRELALQLGAAS